MLNQYLTKLPQKLIAQIITVILLIVLANSLANFTWMVIAPNNNAVALNQVNTTNSVNKASAIDVKPLLSLNLFGEYNKQAVPEQLSKEIQEAPETKLNLTLSGVVASTAKGTGAAIIENNGKQETYGIGDTIVGTRAVLDKVLKDRVIIKQSGKFETLMLDGYKYKKISTPVNQARVNPAIVDSPKIEKTEIDQRNNKALSQQVIALRKDVTNDPGKIADYLRISPTSKHGHIVGYRLSPGKNKEFFAQSGLKHGDIAVQLNGLDLTEPTQAAQALMALREEQEITLTVDRKGDLTDILFSIAN
jgi:general secretion pathway protein C